MTHDTEFTTADVIILNVVKKVKNKFFEKRENFFVWQNFSDAN